MLALQHTWWRPSLASGTQRWLPDIWESHHRSGSAKAAVLEPWPGCHGNKVLNEGLLKVSYLLSEARSFTILYSFPFLYIKVGDDPFSEKRWMLIEHPLHARLIIGALHELFHFISTTA